MVRLYLELGVSIWQPHKDEAGLAPEQSHLALQRPHPWLPACGQLAPPGSLTPDPSSPTHPCLLATSRPPRWPDFTHHFRPNFRFDRGSDGASHVLNELWLWHPGSQVLVLAQPLIYHSLKLSYLLPYLLFASSLGNASSVRTGASPLPAQSRCSGNVCRMNRCVNWGELPFLSGTQFPHL